MNFLLSVGFSIAPAGLKLLMILFTPYYISNADYNVFLDM